MLRKALRAGLSNKTVATRYFVYGQSGRALMGDPEPKVLPRDVFQYQYAFDNYPDQFAGFKYRSHDKYVLDQTFAFEVFEFKYDGEWWNIGSLGVNILYFLMPLFVFILRKSENDTAKYCRGARGAHYQTQGGYLFDSHIHWGDDSL